ncbi:hypothetical protein [Blastococcus sp. SYSU DS0619]
MEQEHGTRGLDVASGLIWFVAISQGAVPLVVRGIFDRDGRFALTLLLPAPWWWISCVAVLALAAVALLLVEDAKERRRPEPAAQPEDGAGAEAGKSAAEGYDALSAIVLLVGVYNGIAPFVARLVFGVDLFLAFTLRLPAPWWWIASLAVVVAAAVALGLIDRAKHRTGGDAPPSRPDAGG